MGRGRNDHAALSKVKPGQPAAMAGAKRKAKELPAPRRPLAGLQHTPYEPPLAAAAMFEEGNGTQVHETQLGNGELDDEDDQLDFADLVPAMPSAPMPHGSAPASPPPPELAGVSLEMVAHDGGANDGANGGGGGTQGGADDGGGGTKGGADDGGGGTQGGALVGTQGAGADRCPWNWQVPEVLACLGAYWEACGWKAVSKLDERRLKASQVFGNWTKEIAALGHWPVGKGMPDRLLSATYRAGAVPSTEKGAAIIAKAAEVRKTVLNVVIPAIKKSVDIPSGRAWDDDYEHELKGIYESYTTENEDELKRLKYTRVTLNHAWRAWCVFGMHGKGGFANQDDFRIREDIVVTDAQRAQDAMAPAPDKMRSRAQQRRATDKANEEARIKAKKAEREERAKAADARYEERLSRFFEAQTRAATIELECKGRMEAWKGKVEHWRARQDILLRAYDKGDATLDELYAHADAIPMAPAVGVPGGAAAAAPAAATTSDEAARATTTLDEAARVAATARAARAQVARVAVPPELHQTRSKAGAGGATTTA